MRLNAIATAALISGITLAGAVAPAHAQIYKQLYAFTGGNDGSVPLAELTAFNGKLFGVADFGGSQQCDGGCGTVFSFDPKTGKEKTVYAFQGSDGAYPQGKLIVVGGILYGTTVIGGAAGMGTVFTLDPQTLQQRVVYSFQSGNDGSNPGSGLVDVNGTLYGTTLYGGSRGAGTVFSINVATGDEALVYAFQGQKKVNPDGRAPYSGVIGVDGTLYGVTSQGGVHDFGTAYAINPATGAETVCIPSLRS